MFSRRALLGGGLGTVLGPLAATPTAAPGSADAADDASVAKEVAALREELRIERHVRWQQPMMLGRDAQGRYTIALNQTFLVLRPDVQGGFVGIAYDSK